MIGSDPKFLERPDPTRSFKKPEPRQLWSASVWNWVVYKDWECQFWLEWISPKIIITSKNNNLVPINMPIHTLEILSNWEKRASTGFSLKRIHDPWSIFAVMVILLISSKVSSTLHWSDQHFKILPVPSKNEHSYSEEANPEEGPRRCVGRLHLLKIR